MSPQADNPPKPWRRRVFHAGTTGSACGAPLTNFLNSIKKPIQIGKQVRWDTFETYINTIADFFVIPVKTGIRHVYRFQNLNWIPAFAGMTDRVVALFVGTFAFFFKESL